MGLPTVAMGVLGLVTSPAQAAAFVVVPSLVTNVWQFLSGAHWLALARRTWPMLVAICLITWASAGLMTGPGAARAVTWLGIALVAYAVIGFAKMHVSVPKEHEAWLSPTVGVATGVVTGATGVFVIPAVPYLQALGLEEDDLVQSPGAFFHDVDSCARGGPREPRRISNVPGSRLYACVAPALVGMLIGQVIRARVNAATFRLVFLTSLLLLGGDLVARSVM